VVVLNTGGPVLMPWLERVGAVVQAWLPGQQFGEALAAVLFGDADPAGRLPVTFPAIPGQGPITGPQALARGGWRRPLRRGRVRRLPLV
jgi:beta-glucosidase